MEKLKDELDAYVPLYNRFKKYFGYLNSGHKGKTFDIYAYNGGLFTPDNLLDTIDINDDLLYNHILKLSSYNFNSEVDVNILGHIFEHSLNEIENVQAEIIGINVERQKTKRKKDGIFYTPKYITKYIVENTVGKLCNEKKVEFQIIEEEFTAEKKLSAKTKQVLLDKLKLYRNWLLKITICDPACGSGAFLNQALDFLIKEHRYIDELQAKLFGDTLILSDIEISILENNLFGVDLNEESVEIAKLSLWLRTAQPNRKLNDLNNNIKCGNSLIDEFSIAGDKAFNWHKQFSDIFDRGGFDIIIGNPPYVFTRGNSYFNSIKDFIWENYPSNKGKINLFGVFLELSLKNLLRPNGYLGFITPETFIRTSTYQEIRKYIFNNYNIKTIELFGNGVFDNVTAESIIMILENSFSTQNEILFRKVESNKSKDYRVKQNSFNLTPQNRFVYEATNYDDFIFEKLKVCSVNLGSIVDTKNGIATKAGKNEFISKSILTENYKKLLEAPEIFRYGYNWKGNYINYDKQLLHRPRKEETFLSEKILVQRVSSKLICAFDNEKYYTFNSINNLLLISGDYSLKYIITLLNSKLINYYYRKLFSFDAGFTITVTKENLDVIPIKIISSNDQKPFIDKADIMISLNKSLQETSQKVQRAILRKLSFGELSKNLEHWYLLSFEKFLKELNKKNIKLSISHEAEWESYFLKESHQALELKSRIEAIDKEIDHLVYKLYDLNDEEIKIIEA